MAWIDAEKIEAIKANLPVVGVIVLSYVVITLFKQNGDLHTENRQIQEQRIKEAVDRADKERQDKLYFIDKYVDLANIRGLSNRDTGR